MCHCTWYTFVLALQPVRISYFIALHNSARLITIVNAKHLGFDQAHWRISAGGSAYEMWCGVISQTFQPPAYAVILVQSTNVVSLWFFKFRINCRIKRKIFKSVARIGYNTLRQIYTDTYRQILWRTIHRRTIHNCS